jgi:HlyD family secretion protein
MQLFNRRNLILLLLLVGTVLGLVLWKEFGAAPPSVMVARAVRGDLAQHFRTNGIVEPAKWREVRASYPGRVMAVYVHEGDVVHAGQSLARLDDRAARAALIRGRAELLDAEQSEASASSGAVLGPIEAQVEAAQADLKVAASARQRNQYLLRQKAIGRPEFDRAEANYEKALSKLRALKAEEQRLRTRTLPLRQQAAQIRIEQARGALAEAKNQLEETRVPAPMTGTVLVRPPDPGTLVNPGSLLAKVGEISHLRVRAFIDQPDFSFIRVGSPVRITSIGFPGVVWKGRVERLSAQLTTLGKRIVGEALCSIDTGDDPLPVNSNVDLTFTGREMKGVLLVPVDAVYQTDNHNVVYLLRGGKLTEQRIRVGASNADSIVVLNGLRPGELVLDDLSVQPKPGMRIRPRLGHSPAGS